MPRVDADKGFVALAKLASLLARGMARVSRILASIAARAAGGGLQEQLVAGSTRYDMVNAPDEPYYASQYWAIIEPALSSLPEDSPCLDLGCSQGRFSYKLAERFPGGRVIACDLSADAVRTAIAGAATRGIGNIEFHCRSIAAQLPLCPAGSFDVILMTEVTFFYPEWQMHMPDLVKLLRPGGVLVMSFRSQYFNALCLTQNRNFEMADMLLQQRRGRIFPLSLTEFSWQQSGEVISIFEQSGLSMLALQGIGVLSGIPGDPHASIARPSLLDESQVGMLMKLELELGRTIPDAGRYILAIGQKA